MGADFERWRRPAEGRAQPAGLTPLDLADLPASQRKIMRLVLRQTSMTYSDLLQLVEALPETERLSRAELDQALEELTGQQWLTRVEDDQPLTYRVNLRRRAASRLTKGIWDALDSGGEADKPPRPSDDQQASGD